MRQEEVTNRYRVTLQDGSNHEIEAGCVEVDKAGTLIFSTLVYFYPSGFAAMGRPPERKPVKWLAHGIWAALTKIAEDIE